MKYDIKDGIKGLIFDLDGTLADTMPYHYEAWQNASLKYGVYLDNDFLFRNTGSPSYFIASEIIKKFNLGNTLTATHLLSEKTVEFNKLQHLIKPITRVSDIVKRYYKKLPMAIGTGGHRSTVEITLKNTGLKKYFDIIVTADDIKNFKPDPETFLICSELMKVDPAYIEVFEDTEFGLQAARTAGMIATDVRQWIKPFS